MFFQNRFIIFTVENSSQKFGMHLDFLSNRPKKAIAQLAEIRQILSPWLFRIRQVSRRNFRPRDKNKFPREKNRLIRFQVSPKTRSYENKFYQTSKAILKNLSNKFYHTSKAILKPVFRHR
jgi:hypothetical protein